MPFIQKLFGREPSEDEPLHGSETYRLGVVEDLLKEAIRAYQALIEGIATHAAGNSPEQSKEGRERSADFKRKLKHTRNLLNVKPSKPLMAEVGQQLERTIESYNR